MGRRGRKGDPVHGWVALDKPLGLTSTQAVGRVRRLFNAAKAGHAGALDPLATGLLPLALGEATKTVPFVMDGVKEYRFTIRWGAETDTDDAEGDVVATSDDRPSERAIREKIEDFVGDIEQVPPRFSALKVAGERAYDLAREGADFELQARTIRVDDLRIAEIPDADNCILEAVCGKGTYVRALARDLGRALGCHGHVVALRRTRVGPFRESDMISLDKLEEIGHSAAGRDGLAEFLLPVETALDDIPALAVSGSDAARLQRGQAVLLRGRDAPLVKGTVYATSRGALVAVAEARKGELHPKRVFNLSG